MSTILVVDDEHSITLILQMILEDEGYAVSVAHDGYQALQVMAQQPPDLVITDLMMPIMNGLELTRRICLDYAPSPPRLILMSAVGEPANRGVYHSFLQKPFDLDTALAVVEAQLGPPG